MLALVITPLESAAVSPIIVPELVLPFSYPQTTHLRFVDSALVVRREVHIRRIRDLVCEPLTVEDFLRRPFNRRSRYLIIGVERSRYRQFYLGCSVEYRSSSQLRIGIYGGQAGPLELIGRGFDDDVRERKIMIRLLERWREKTFGDKMLGIFADDFRLVS